MFIDTNRGKEISAIVEHVFNASMVRLYLPSKATYITLSLAGIRAPSQRGSDGAPEAFFELARYTVESKLLGRDLNVIVEGAAPMGSNKERFILIEDENTKVSLGKVEGSKNSAYSTGRSLYSRFCRGLFHFGLFQSTSFG